MFRIVLAALLWSLATFAAPLLTINVDCDGKPCGVLDVNTYEKYLDLDREGGGAIIEADWSGAKGREFHFLSAITKDTAPPKYADGSALPIPYADTPPGGYKGSKGKIADFLPWYPFESGVWTDKHFEDAPFNPFLSVVTLNDKGEVTASKDVDVFFETWLVCLIETKGKVDPKKGPAKDASYKVAALAGFEWGFTLSWMDKNGDKKAQLGEFDSTLKALAKVAAPTADMTKAFAKGTTYGKAMDFFDVDLTGDCKDCFATVPEPVSVSYLVVGALFLGITRLRRRKL
jgi:hypothetical protein